MESAMPFTQFLDQLQNSEFAFNISSGLLWRWLFPTIETLHVIAIATVVGSIFLVDLRLLGFAGRPHRASALMRQLLPYTWVAFAFAVTTGLLMFVSRALDYSLNFAFQVKMLLLLLAGVNMLIFHLGAHRSIGGWDIQCPPPAAARISAGISIIIWTLVVFFGRWIGFTLEATM